MSEPVRIDGMPGYETRIDATSGKDNTPVTWCNGCGSAANGAAHHRKRAARRLAKAFPRFRAVRDGIQPRG
jgi:hypothetical protein